MKSVMTHKFSQVPAAEIERSSFDRSHGHKTTFDAGYLVPVFVDEALPGDTFKLNMTAFARLATPIKPVMDNMFLESFFFAVPYRLVWDNWERFNGYQASPGDPTNFVIPTVPLPMGGVAVGSLADYFGLPTGALAAPVNVSALWFRAYNLIYNNWFKDENLQTAVVDEADDGPDEYADFALLRRGKRHDYFTSCLPWPQKGTAVTIPLGSTAPVIANGDFLMAEAGHGNTHLVGQNAINNVIMDGAGFGTKLGYVSGLITDLTNATAATINSLRQAFQLQKLYERDARGGTRYTEIIRAHFGVVSPDARLQRPEYLGGGSTPVNIHPVAQTSVSAATPQGNLSAFGTAGVQNHGFTKSFTEHCLLLGLVSVRADLTYQTGLNRMWTRSTRFDFYWPALAHIGEQAVLTKEIFCDGSGNDSVVFGYQERFAEYRYKPSLITGLFRSQAAGTLDFWHLSQDFETAPTLGSSFIVEDPPVARVIAVDSEPHFLFDSYIELNCTRPMPVYGVPGMIDRF